MPKSQRSQNAELYKKLKSALRKLKPIEHDKLIAQRCQLALKTLEEIANYQDSGELGELLEAIRTGKNHPLLRYWIERRSRNRPSGTKAVIELKYKCVVFVHALTKLGLYKGQASELVASAASKSGAFERKVTTDMLRDWEKTETDPIDATWFVDYYENNPYRLLNALMRGLVAGTLESSYYDEELWDE